MSRADRARSAAAIVGVAGLVMSDEERRLIAKARPLGFILFARNCENPEQVQALTRSLREATDDPLAPVLIDQEGGRVTRLKPPAWRAICAPRCVGRLAEVDLDAAKEAAWLHARLIAADLEPLGITVNCAPVLDLGLAGQTKAIGDRAFSDDPAKVAILGGAMIQGYLDGGVLPVIKHLPGHGRALVDSHRELPRVEEDVDLLRAADWPPFSACKDAPFAMTAHILFGALDALAPATQSARVIQEVIRSEIGFEGAILSDDLSMQALGGSLGERTARARQAGCDLALHCNGDLPEMSEVLAAAGPLEGKALDRVEAALARREPPSPFDRVEGRARLEFLVSAYDGASETIA